MEGVFLKEIFSSIQGEGPWVGERQIFVRFIGCDIHCRYCDTPVSIQHAPDEVNQSYCSVQTSLSGIQFEQVKNPISIDALSQYCSRLIVPGQSKPTISLTGGEPLMQTEFLKEWLPLLAGIFRIYLETNGLHADAVQDIIGMVDIISMDFKLPSATGLQPFWEAHKKFLLAAIGKTIFIKVVVTTDTSPDDIITAARIIAEFDHDILLVIQPAHGSLAPSSPLLMTFQEAALGTIPNVRIIPQVHKILHVP